MSNKYYISTENSDYTKNQICNYNNQIDILSRSIEIELDDEIAKSFADSFCNSISETNKNGKIDLYKQFI